MSEWEWFQAKQVKGLFAAAQSTATAGSSPIPNAAQVKQNAATKMPPPAPISASYPGASGQPTSQQSSPVSRSSFGPWYRARLGKLPIILQVILWWFYGFIWIPIWWFVSRNEMSALPSKSGVAFASGDRAVKPTSKSAFNLKSLIATLGICLLLLVLLIPAIQSARDAVSRKNGSSAVGNRSESRQGVLSSFDEVPPPIEAALAAGKEIWLLQDYYPNYITHKSDKIMAQVNAKYRVAAYLVVEQGENIEQIVGVRYEPFGKQVEWSTEDAVPECEFLPSDNGRCVLKMSKHEREEFATPGWFIDKSDRTRFDVDMSRRVGSWSREFIGYSTAPEHKGQDINERDNGKLKVLTARKNL